jgi:hypothetical protein
LLCLYSGCATSNVGWDAGCHGVKFRLLYVIISPPTEHTHKGTTDACSDSQRGQKNLDVRDFPFRETDSEECRCHGQVACPTLLLLPRSLSAVFH